MTDPARRRRGRLRSLALALALTAAGILGAVGLEVETDITHFLPPASDARLTEITRAVATSDLNRTLTLAIEAPDEDVAASAARSLASRLRERPGIAWVRGDIDESLEQAFYELYFPRRLGFALDSNEEAAAILSEEALRERARQLRARLGSPMGPLVRRIAPEDPWLLFPAHLERIRESMRGTLRVHDGAFVTEDGRHGIVWLATERSPFDTAASARLEEALASDFAAVNRAHRGRLTLEQGGVHRIALESERSVRRDVTRVSAVGTAALVLFLTVLFGSPRYVLVGCAPRAAGVAAAVAVSAATFGRIHGLTLAFGATGIGVAVDYVAHYLNHHVLAPSPAGPQGTLRRVWPGLLLGGLTTVAGLAALGWTGYPAIREMALFTSVGVLAALFATRFLMPPWLPERPTPTRLHLSAARAVGRALAALEGRRRLLWTVPIAAALLIAAGASRFETRDDPQAIAATDPSLLAEDARVRSRVARVDAGRFVAAFGATVEEALRVNDGVHAALEEARGAGHLGRQRSLHSLLWSAEMQRRSHRALTSDRSAADRTAQAYAAEGFVEEAFGPFERALAAPFEPLTLAALRQTPLAPLVDPFVIEVGDGGFAILTFLHDVRNGEAVARRLSEVDGAVYWDQSEYMTQAYAGFRARTFELLAAGMVLVLLLVLVRYRSAQATAAAVAPALVAGAGSLAAALLLGQPLTLVHALGLLLVLAMGVDYGVFLVETGSDAANATPTVVSLVVACVSTVLSFGALAFSTHPALQALGTVTGVGVALSLLFAPVTWLLVRKPPPRSG